MIPLIGAAISAIPSLIDLFTGDDKSEAVKNLAKTAGKALGIEDASPQDVMSELAKDPEAYVKLKEVENEAKRIQNEELKERNAALQKDLEERNRHVEELRKQAHETYRVDHTMADKIAMQIVQRNLPIIGVLVLVNIALVYWMKDNANLIAIASNIIGVAIGNLFNERQAIVNFFFGSSVGSKQKDQVLQEESKKAGKNAGQ